MRKKVPTNDVFNDFSDQFDNWSQKISLSNEQSHETINFNFQFQFRFVAFSFLFNLSIWI